jgi:glycosyltransferase involved in cell wall biosynthesis
MKVLLDTTPLLNGNSGRGVGTYTRQLLKGLRAISAGKQLEVIATHELKKGEKLDRSQFDLIHMPYFDLFFMTMPLVSKVPTIVTIHDVIPLVFPQQFIPGIKGGLRFLWQKWAVGRAQAIITDSQVSKSDIVKHLGISAHKIHVVPLAASEEFAPQSEYFQAKYRSELELPEKYIVYIGDINYNKNLPTLLLALTELPDVHLVVVSGTFTNTNIPEGRKLAEIIRENDLEDRIHLPRIPVDKPEILASVLQGAKCLVQPSLYEGFGLPVLEALQSGAVVVSSNAGSLPEVAGNAAILVEPTIAGLQKGIEEAVHLRGTEREDRIAKGLAWAKNFSWEKAAIETLSVYESVIQGRV